MEIIKILKDETQERLLLLKYIISFLSRLLQHSEYNKTTSKILAEELCPVISSESKTMNINLFKLLIEHPEFVPKKAHTDYSNIVPQIVFAEEIIFYSDQVAYIGDEGHCEGILFISNFKLIFNSRPRADGSERPVVLLPLASILSLEKKESKEKTERIVTIRTKTNLLVKLLFATNQSYSDVMDILNLFTIPQPVNLLFAYQAGLYREIEHKDNTLKQYDADYIRQGINIPEDWSFTEVPYSKSYPINVLVPTSILKKDKELPQRVAKAYVLGCFPTLVYSNLHTSGCILRSGTTNSTLMSFSSTLNLRKANERSRSNTLGDSKSPKSPRKIGGSYVQERIKLLEGLSQLVPGGSFETINCKLVKDKTIQRGIYTFPNPNELHQELYDALLEHHESPTAKLKIHQWIASICSVLTASVSLTTKIFQGCSVMVEDDYHFSFPLISLTMLMLDPYYRTISGFQILIEHIWIRFGFPFAISSGFGSSNKSADPFDLGIFNQFIDCVWQMYAQYNSCFEFNELFLIEILDATTSGEFGTFLCNNEREALYNNSITPSLWEYINRNRSKYLNEWYNIESNEYPLVPDCSSKRVTFWSSYYLRWFSIDGSYQASNVLSKFGKEEKILDLSHLLLTKLPNSTNLHSNIEVLDLSFNLLCLVPLQIGNLKKLRSLIMNSNKLTFIPQDLIVSLQNCENLTALDFRTNSISIIDDSICALKNLNSLQLGGSGTFACKIPPSIFELENLHTLAIEGFKLINHPPDISKLKNLKSLSLSQNCLISFEIESNSLENINLRYNQLTPQSISFKNCNNLKIIDLSHNRLDRLPDSILNCLDLEKLFITNNQLISISPYLRRFKKLKTLDITQNHVTYLPPTLGFIPLETFKFKGNPIGSPDKSTLGQTTSALLLDLRKIIDQKSNSNRIRIMVVGQENVGKSSMSFALRNGTPSTVNISTDGIYINPWKLQIGNNNNIDIDIWDFAGQEIYYTTHQLFLSDKAMYLVVWNIMDKFEDTKLIYWLESIKLLTNNAPTILVGTHMDQEVREKVHKTLQRIANRLHSKYPFIKGITSVSCTTCIGFPELQDRISNVLQEQLFLKKELPLKYQFFEKEILCQRIYRKPPVINLNEYKELANLYSIEDDEISKVSELFHNWGIILYYEDIHIKDMITLDPRWLIQLLSCIITTKHRYIKQGILLHSDLVQIWHQKDYPIEYHPKLLHILQKFEITFPLEKYDINNYDEWLKGKSLIPSALPISPGNHIFQLFPKFEPCLQYSRNYNIPFVPSGFLNHVIIKVIQQLTDVHYWRFGVLGYNPENVSSKLKVELDPNTSLLSVESRGESSLKLFLCAVDIIESFISIWTKLQVIISVPCPHCFQNRSTNIYSFSYDYCKESAISGKSFLECGNTGSSVRLDMLVPDLSMVDVTRIEYSDIDIEKEIGKGGFATVYKANYHRKIVAVKVLDIGEGSSAEEIFNDFLRETWIMNGIKHPNIIGFHGICTKPLSIMTDFAAYGNLYEFLHNDKYIEEASDKALKLKIALDISRGMQFLHNRVPPVIHSDLKSPNILLLSKKPSDKRVAVVADFGLSKSWIPSLKGRNVDNPVWLAPEILSGKEYSESADVYAFGVILYEILTLKAFFSEYTFLSAMEDAIIAGKRPEIDKNILDNNENNEIISIINDCWQNDPEKRPIFQNITERILLIIKKLIPDDKIYTLDEVILSVDRKKSKPELWVTNDEAYIKSITNEVSNITNCIVTNNESSLWCADSEGMMSVYDIDDKYSIEKVYPIYNTKYTTVLSTSENTIWTNSKGSKKIHIWEGYTGKLLRTALCAQTIYELIELENDVCAVTSGGLFFWNLQLGLPSRFDNLCPPFSPKSLSTTLQKVKSQLTDSFNGISIHVKHVVSPTKCIFQYFTRKELNHWLTTRKFCSSPIGDEVNELVNQILEFEIVRPVLCNPTKNEPALDDYFVLTNKFFGDVDILSDNQCGIVLQAIIGLPDVKTSCYDKEEHNLWVGSSGGFVVLDCRTLSVIVRIKLSSPIYKIVIVNDTVWMCSDNLLLYNKYTLSQSIIDAHESNVTHITKTKDFIITAADNLSLFVWTYDGQLVRDITLKSRCLDLLYIQSKNHLLVATEKKTIDIWDVSKFESINDDTTINQVR